MGLNLCDRCVADCRHKREPNEIVVGCAHLRKLRFRHLRMMIQALYFAQYAKVENTCTTRMEREMCFVANVVRESIGLLWMNWRIGACEHEEKPSSTAL